MMEFRSPNAEEEKLKVKAAAELEADRVRLLMDQPFVGAFLIRQNLVPVVDCRCETAATDGQNIFVDPVFYLNLKPGERRFLLAHEVWHTVFLHFLPPIWAKPRSSYVTKLLSAYLSYENIFPDMRIVRSKCQQIQLASVNRAEYAALIILLTATLKTEGCVRTV